MILIISIVHVQVLIPGQGDAEFNSLKRDQKPRLLYRQLGDPEKLETISQTSSVNPVKALSCEILSIYCVEKNKTSTIINISITVSIIGLEPARPGYQAWVHTVVWFGQNCAPRPGTQAW